MLFFQFSSLLKLTDAKSALTSCVIIVPPWQDVCGNQTSQPHQAHRHPDKMRPGVAGLEQAAGQHHHHSNAAAVQHLGHQFIIIISCDRILTRGAAWPSGKALGWEVRRRALARFLFSSPLSSTRLWFVDTVLWLCPSQLMKHQNGSRRCPS